MQGIFQGLQHKSQAGRQHGGTSNILKY